MHFCTVSRLKRNTFLLNRYICKTESYLLATRSMTLFELSHCCIVSFHFHTMRTIVATLAYIRSCIKMCYKFFVLRSFQSSWEDLVSNINNIIKKHQNYVNF